MSSLVNPQPEPPTNDELVAYLDGELAPDECRRVEDRLASDDEYRQQLRDLDQAWEALSALPTTAVDDGFARTTIELACVAAEEDLSQRTAQAAAENRGRKRWWISAGVAAAVMGFVMMRALAVHRNNAILADLPVIGQVNALAHVTDVDFLRRLSSAVPVDKLASDKPAYDRTLAEFTSANAATLDERRKWLNSLSAEQKADLADRSRAFEELLQNPQEKKRLRKLTNKIRGAEDAAKLQETLVAYGQWLSRHTAGEQEKIREDFQDLSPNQQIDAIQRRVQRENEQAARHLSPEDRAKLRNEIFELAKEERAKWLEKLPPGVDRNRIPNMDANNVGPVLYILSEALRNDENSEATINRLLSKLSPATNEHWKRLSRWQWDKRRRQLSAWIHEAIQTKWGPEDLELFFVSDKLTNDQRQKLLDMPRSKMEAELERLYLKSELGVDERWQLMRELGDGGRGQRNGPGPPDGNRPGTGRRPDGPPPDPRFRPDGQPGERFDRERPPGPGGQRGRRPNDRLDDGRPGERPRRRPNDQLPPNGPPPTENAPPI
jgi:hypothetical protein